MENFELRNQRSKKAKYSLARTIGAGLKELRI